MHQLILVGAGLFPPSQTELLKGHLNYSFPNIIVKAPSTVYEVYNLMEKHSPLHMTFIILNNRISNPQIEAIVNKLQSQRARYLIYHTELSNQYHRVARTLEEVQSRLKDEVLHFKGKSNPHTKLNVSVVVVQSKNSKFRHQARQLYNKIRVNPRVAVYQCQNLANSEFISNAGQAILIVHPSDIPRILEDYQQLIEKIAYGKLVVIVYGDQIKPYGFKFDIKVKDYAQLQKQVEWLIQQSVAKIKIKDPSYRLVVLDGDSIFRQFYRLLPQRYEIVNSLNRREGRCLVIAPSSKQQELTKYLQVCSSSLGIISTVQSNPAHTHHTYHHPSIKLVTNSLRQCVNCIYQLNDQVSLKPEKTISRHKSQYNPSKANMWQRLQNQLKNQLVKNSRRPESQGRTLRDSRALSSGIKKKTQSRRMATSPNEEYQMSDAPYSQIQKKGSKEPSTKLSSLLPSSIKVQSINYKGRQVKPSQKQGVGSAVKAAQESKSIPQEGAQSSLSFGELSCIPSQSAPTLNKQLFLESKIQNVHRKSELTKQIKQARMDLKDREQLSDISNIVDFQGFHQHQLHSQPPFTLGYPITQTVPQSPLASQFPSPSQSIQIFFKTSNHYISKLEQYFSNSSPFYYKYQNLKQLKEHLRISHQQALSLAILDEEQITEAMRLLAVFDNMYFLVAAPSTRINYLQNILNRSVGFIPEQIPLKRSFKEVSAYIRLLKMKHHRVGNSDLKRHSDQLLNKQSRGSSEHIIYYPLNDKHIRTLMNAVDESGYFDLREYASLGQLEHVVQHNSSHHAKTIIILNGHLASATSPLVNAKGSNIKFLIFQPNKFLHSGKPLSVPLASSDSQLITQIRKMIEEY